MTVSAERRPIRADLLKVIFTSENVPALFAGVSTHDPARDLVAQLVSHTKDAELIGRLVSSALPENYRGDTLDELDAMVRGAIDKGFDQASPPTSQPVRATASSRILEALEAKGVELYHDQQRRSFMRTPLPSGGWLDLLIRSPDAELWVRDLFFRTFKKAVPSSQLRDVMDTLEASALFAGTEHSVFVRVGSGPGVVCVDLGEKDGKMVEILPDGWRVTATSPVRFWRPPGLKALPEPTPGGDIEALWHLLNLDQAARPLTLAFLLNALRPGGPYLCLLIEGEQGSGKSILCQVIKRIVDPHQVEKLQLPASKHDLMIQAKDNYLLVYDNVSGIKAEISDALCMLATGGGISVRKLYTDDVSHVFNYCRPFIINGISDFATRPDLVERSIVLTLPSMPMGQRRPEADMFAEFQRILPSILGCLYDAVAHALRTEGSIPAIADFRMADAARWITAAEPAFGTRPGSIIDVVRQVQGQAMVERVENDPIVVQLENLLKPGPFEGTVGKLFECLFPPDERGRPWDRTRPGNAAHLSRRLKRLKPAMERAGIYLEFGDRTRMGKSVRIWRAEPESTPTLSNEF